ncbi:PxKF domain-containing protein [Streptomyces sp. NBC_00212]|uniref:PxKF domain-containing protein n=1 Tax=Streptomyces sp. NBC_00212 TaxID=2975684 RepID=UPI003247726B
MLATAGTAHADANIQITNSADPVPVNTPYNDIVTVPQTGVGISTVVLNLSGAAATFTGCTSTVPGQTCLNLNGGTQLQCIFLGAAANATITATVLPTAAGTVTAQAALDSQTGGPSGTDSTTTTITPAGPVYTFTGFFQPVDNPPTVNTMKAARAVPVKFSLNGDQGLNILATGYPASQNVTCDTGAPIEETTGAGQSSLTYHTATYTYVWKTDSTWSNTCRAFDLKLADNSDHTANFKFS